MTQHLLYAGELSAHILCNQLEENKTEPGVLGFLGVALWEQIIHGGRLLVRAGDKGSVGAADLHSACGRNRPPTRQQSARWPFLQRVRPDLQAGARVSHVLPRTVQRAAESTGRLG